MPREAWVLVKAVVSDAYPDQGLPGPQPPMRPPVYPDQGLPGPQPIPGWPAYPGGPGGGLPGNAPRPDNTLPGQQPGIWGPTDPRPSHPIYIPVTPPPESGLEPTHPIYIPVYPDNTLPGSQPRPDNTLPGNQPYPDNTLPQPTPALIEKIKKAIDFWTGNLPTDPAEKPTPV